MILEPWQSYKKYDPTHIKDALKTWMKKASLDSGWKKFKAISEWQKLAEEQNLTSHVVSVGYRNQTLEVTLDTSSCYFEVMAFKKALFLQELQSRCKEADIPIKNIRFICGSA